MCDQASEDSNVWTGLGLPLIVPYLEQIPLVLLAGVISVIWYYIFWKPLDWFRDVSDFGFESTHASKCSNRSKQNTINEIRKRRKLGEIPPVYPNGWFIILESNKLLKKKAVDVCVLGLNLVAWRGESGKAYVADAYCPHIGAHLGVGGSVCKERIVCPFHGWEFEGETGNCAKIPYSTTTKLEGAKINVRTTREQNGLILLWFHAESEEPSWFPDPITEIESGQWVYRGKSEFITSSHIQDVVENLGDINHLNVLHGAAVLAGSDPERARFPWSGVRHVWEGVWKACTENGRKHIGTMELFQHLELFSRFKVFRMHFKASQIGPGIVRMDINSLLGNRVILVGVTPLGPTTQRITHWCYSSRSQFHPVAKLTLLFHTIMISRDVAIWNRKTYVGRPPLPKEDSTMKMFRLWFLQFYTENSPRYNSADSKTENILY